AGHLLGAVDGEGEVGDVTDTHAVAEVRANVSAGSDQTFESGGFFFLVAVDCYEDAGGFSAGRQDYVGNVGGSDTRIGEFAFQHGSNLFGKGVRDSIAVVSSGSMF